MNRLLWLVWLLLSAFCADGREEPTLQGAAVSKPYAALQAQKAAHLGGNHLQAAPGQVIRLQGPSACLTLAAS